MLLRIDTMTIKHVLVATDFAECSTAAVDYAIDIALRHEAALTLVHVFELPYYADTFTAELIATLQQAADAKLARALEAIRARVPGADGVVQCGSAWEQILAVTRQVGADLIVVGSHGRKGLPRAILGSIAEKVVRLSPVPVLTVHGRVEQAPRP